MSQWLTDQWNRITLRLNRLIVSLKMGSAFPETNGLNVGTMDIPEKNEVLWTEKENGR